MVLTKLHFTKLNNKKARSHFNSICVRVAFCWIVLFFIIPKAHAVRWEEPETSSPWKGVWGQRDDNQIYIGMWTRHLPGHNSNKNNINRLIGANIYGIFGAMFYNSYDIKSYTLGLQRVFYSKRYPHYLQLDFGYRLGVIWGYKNTRLLSGLENIIPGIKSWNVIPFPQLYGNFSWELIGIQVSYCWAVVTAGFYVKF